MRIRKRLGLRDKLYWREVRHGRFHCFRRLAGSGDGQPAACVSLCGAYEILRSGGQASRRPEPVLRCARCDGLECRRRGWDESGPTLEPRLSLERGRES